MKILPLSALSLIFYIFAYGQDHVPTQYSKLIISQEITADEAVEITETIAEIVGVTTSRMDPITHVYLAIYDVNSNLNETTLINWFENRGYTVACFYSADYVFGKLVDISQTNCH